MAKSKNSKTNRKSTKNSSILRKLVANRSLISLASFAIVFGGIGAYIIGTSHAANTTYQSTWEAEYTGIQQPNRHDKTPIEHTGGTRISGAWRSDPAGNNLHYAMWGPYTTDGAASCGFNCSDTSKTARFYLRASNPNGGNSVARIEVHSQKAAAANADEDKQGNIGNHDFIPTVSRATTVTSGAYKSYDLNFTLGPMGVCPAPGPSRYQHCTVVEDLEFRVMVIKGRIDIDKVQLYH